MPTWQGEAFLERALASLAAQRCSLPWDFLAIDSGSRDRTLAILESFRARFPVPFAVRSIHQVEFDHGDTRNQLAAFSRGELLVFLTQDAIPVGTDWLERLARNFEDTQVAAAYCRNVPRADCHPLTRILSEADPGYAPRSARVRLPAPEVYAALSPHERRLLYNFNDVASALRRELWQLHPFPRTWFGEDVLLARALLEAGYTIAYEGEAAVEHSHDYDAAETRTRARIDGRFNAEWLGRVAIQSRSDARVLADRLAPQDAQAVRAAGFSGERARELEREAHALRLAAFEGLHEGGQSEVRRAPTGLLARSELKLLFVVHGFPPETWAGTEVYTLNLAHALRARGHEVTILARGGAPAEGGPPDFSIAEERFEGLRVLRMTHRLAHGSLRESYRQPRAEARFRALLAEERFDLVHFQHLIHSSCGLVEVAREAGIPSIAHCHDYWALCARVQMIRPDGALCPENMGAGCYLCVKEKHLEHVPRAKALGALTAPLDASVLAGLGQPEYRELREREQIVPAAYAAADLQISPSRFLREKLLASGHFDAHRFLYSDNGLRLPSGAPAAKRPDARGRVRFGFIGSLVWYKGGELMLRAMSQLAGRNALLRVHGDFRPAQDAHHAELERLARQSGAEIEFRGRFDNARLAEVYAELDVLLVPSLWYENSPITIREAFLHHTPVVATRLGGMAESVRDGVDGLLFEPGSAQDLARVMARFVDEPELAARLGSARTSVKSIEENALELEHRYRGLVCARRSALPALVADFEGAQTTRRSGPVETQGADLALLRPGGAAVEYEFELPASRAPAALELRIELQFLGGETGVELGGHALLDGQELLRFAPRRAGTQDERAAHEARSTAAVAAGRHVLRIESALDAQRTRELHLRIARVRVRSLPDEAPAERAPAPSAHEVRA